MSLLILQGSHCEIRLIDVHDLEAIAMIETVVILMIDDASRAADEIEVVVESIVVIEMIAVEMVETYAVVHTLDLDLEVGQGIIVGELTGDLDHDRDHAHAHIHVHVHDRGQSRDHDHGHDLHLNLDPDESIAEHDRHHYHGVPTGVDIARLVLDAVARLSQLIHIHQRKQESNNKIRLRKQVYLYLIDAKHWD